MVKHKNKMFAAGVHSNKSRLYYSDALNAEAWTGGDAGSIDIDPDDGDRITGLISHKNELFIFKGPHRLSVHRLTGSAATGDDAYARIPFVTGVGAVNHNSIFRVNDDVVFASPRGLHSLAATAAYGDYVEAFLARPILSYYQDNLNHTLLNTSWGVNYQAAGLAIWTFPKAGSSVKDVMLVYDYRFQPGRWARWDSGSGYKAANCLAIFTNLSPKRPRLYAGDTSGQVWELDKAARVIGASTAYTWDVKTPFMNLGSSAMLKTVEEGYLSVQPKGAYSLTVGYTRDQKAEDSVSLTQAGGNTLG
jgi:hypothetical protein